MPLDVFLFLVGIFLLGVGVTLGVQWVINQFWEIAVLEADTKRLHMRTKRLHMSWCKKPPCETPEYHR